MSFGTLDGTVEGGMVGRAEGQALGALEEGVAVRGLTDIQLTSREALHSIKQISSSQRTQF